MRRVWRAWVELCSRRESATSIGLLRIAVGLVVLYSLLSIWQAELVTALWVDVGDGGMRHLGTGNHLVRALGGPDAAVVWSLFATALGAAVLFTAGLGGRVTALVLVQCYLALRDLNGDASGGYDSMICNALWLLVLAPCTATLSLDCLLRRGRPWVATQVPAWPRYLFIAQLLVVYGFTGWQKVALSWTPLGGYSALYWVLQDPNWQRADWSALAAWLYPLTQLATALTWHWEQLAPLLLLVYYFRATRDRPGRLRALCNRRDLRLPFALVGVGLHVGIGCLMQLGPFSWIALAYYIALWHPAEIEHLWAGLRRRVGGGGTAPA